MLTFLLKRYQRKPDHKERLADVIRLIPRVRLFYHSHRHLTFGRWKKKFNQSVKCPTTKRMFEKNSCQMEPIRGIDNRAHTIKKN